MGLKQMRVKLDNCMPKRDAHQVPVPLVLLQSSPCTRQELSHIPIQFPLLLLRRRKTDELCRLPIEDVDHPFSCLGKSCQKKISKSKGHPGFNLSLPNNTLCLKSNGIREEFDNVLCGQLRPGHIGDVHKHPRFCSLTKLQVILIQMLMTGTSLRPINSLNSLKLFVNCMTQDSTCCGANLEPNMKRKQQTGCAFPYDI
jgi:hypothetical protein